MLDAYADELGIHFVDNGFLVLEICLVKKEIRVCLAWPNELCLIVIIKRRYDLVQLLITLQSSKFVITKLPS